jgi:hypothetical protein
VTARSPRRWAVERTNGWITAHRRLARACERHPGHSESMIRRAMIGVLARRLTRGRPATRTDLSPSPDRGLIRSRTHGRWQVIGPLADGRRMDPADDDTTGIA